jgi:hypothetical protein
MNAMSALAEVMRLALFDQMARLSAEERVRLTAPLARSDLELYWSVRGLNLATDGRALGAHHSALRAALPRPGARQGWLA